MSNRPRVGVSSCLLGEAVRYNGEHKRDAWLVEELGQRVEWVPVCPEVEAGFGTPREPMEVERGDEGRIRLMTVSSRQDLTERLQTYAAGRVGSLARECLDGYVFKDRSPSCDPGFGLYAAAVQAALPDIPVIDEQQLSDATARDAFVASVFAHHRAGRALAAVDIVRVTATARHDASDNAAAEEPLEIRLHGRPFAVVMRTPGADRDLAAGFLLAERVIRNADDLGAIEHCQSATATTNGNIVNVTLTDDAAASLDRFLDERRNVTTNSSCGLCGRQTIESLAVDVQPIRSQMSVAAAVLAGLPESLRRAQTVFAETGGLHAAGLFTPSGALVDIAEDVGRHNAVDKVVGRMLIRESLPLSGHILCVSGRTSFEIVQKALFAGVPIVAAVSAPSTLAIDLARTCGITLAGFVRGDTFNIYSHPHRIV